MDEEIDGAARRINDVLPEGARVEVTELCALLGGSRDTLARTLAWLLTRGLITFVRDKGRLYVMRQGAAASRESAARVPARL
jgi:hypothetical protein